MLNVKEEYLNTIHQIIDIARKTDCSVENASMLANVIEQQELLVPVVGEFSAGKSSFLNSFIGKNVLSVAVTPETAIATELRYSKEEYVEVVFKDDSTKRIPFESAVNIEPNWKNLRLFLNSENLKSIAPIVLVDMPGFDSPRGDHNKAILNYLDKGVHYIVLTSVESGTITSSMKRQLIDIQNMERSFSFFVSKANLRSAEDTLEICEEISERISEVLDIDVDVKSLGKNAGEELSKLLKSIDPNSLFENLFKNKIVELIDEVASSIDVKLASLQLDKEKARNAIADMQEALSKLNKRKEYMLAEARSERFDDDVERIVSAAGQALSSNTDSFVSLALNGGGDAVQPEMTAVVQSAIAPVAKQILAESSQKISSNFRVELKELDDVFANLNVPGMMDKISSVAANFGSVAKSSLASLSKSASQKAAATGANVAYKAIAGALGIATSFLAPIVEVLILFLPEILSFFGKSLQEKQQRENIRRQIIASYPKIKNEIRSSVTPLLRKQYEDAIQEIADEYDSKIKLKQTEIDNALRGIEEDNDAKVKIGNLQNAKKELEKIHQVKFN